MMDIDEDEIDTASKANLADLIEELSSERADTISEDERHELYATATTLLSEDAANRISLAGHKGVHVIFYLFLKYYYTVFTRSNP